MTKQKQIEEMATHMLDYCDRFQTCPYVADSNVTCDICKARSLYNAGYRKGETTSYQAMVDSSFMDRINDLENSLIEARKETAKEILQNWYDENKSKGDEQGYVIELAEKYGVEVEE